MERLCVLRISCAGAEMTSIGPNSLKDFGRSFL